MVHYPDNSLYVLDTNSSDFQQHYHELLERLDYLTKVESKIFGKGDRNFGCSQIDRKSARAFLQRRPYYQNCIASNHFHLLQRHFITQFSIDH
ncbi:hypothetical protein AO724_12600 [Aeromonas allosaccharophila]|uniref:YagK/YfjJ domain-containing protein n=1 Tax=Aeromonas TaxID=642 RepID=UPI000717E998|nr:hypothetical protein AO724_12600 [Aeromonas allosaccharophila]